jgi:3',5'-cyclic-AMP phosphodiesterase
MHTIEKFIFSLLVMIPLTVVLQSCSHFEYHPYETNVDYHNLNEKAISRIQQEFGDKDTITFIAMGDTQRFYDEVVDFVSSANQQNVDFVFLNGDITDFGLKEEFQWVHERMEELKVPYVAVIGNHDMVGNGTEVFTKMYGALDYSFVLNDYKFVCLNTNSREYNFNGQVPDIGWLGAELSGGDSEHAVVVAHVAPFGSDFDERLSTPYVNTLYENNVILSLHAHSHSFSAGKWRDDEVPFLISTSMNERMYLLVKLAGGEFTYEKIYY